MTSMMEYSGFKNSVLFVSLNRNASNHDLKLDLIRDGTEQLTLASSGFDERNSDSRSVSEKASVFAPFLADEPIDIAFALNGNGSGYGCDLELKLSENRSVSFSTNLFMNFQQNDVFLDANIRLAIPYVSFPRFDLGVNHASSLSPSFKTASSIFVSVNEERHEGSFEVGLRKETASYGSRLSVGSPLIGSEPVTLAGFLRPSLYAPALQIELGIPGSTIIALSRLDRLEDGGIFAIASLEAPFLDGNKIELIGEYNLGEKLVLKTSALLGTGRGFRFEVRYFFVTLKNFDVGFMLKTPWEQYDNRGLLVQLAMDNSMAVVNGTVVGTFNDDEYTVGFFKETVEQPDSQSGLTKGELVVGLPRMEMLRVIGLHRKDDEIFSLNLISDQGKDSTKLKIERDQSNNQEAFQFTIGNTNLLPLPNFDLTGDLFSAETNTVSDEDFTIQNRTYLGSLDAKYSSVGDLEQLVKLKGSLGNRQESNDFGDQKSYANGLLDMTSTIPGLEQGRMEYKHDWTTGSETLLIDTITASGFKTNLTILSNLNFGEEKTKMELKLTDQTTKKNQYYRIVSQYKTGDIVIVNGQFQSSIPKYKNIPWTIEYDDKKGPSESVDYTGGGNGDYGGEGNENPDYQGDEGAENPGEQEETVGEWYKSIKLNVKLPDKPLDGSFFINNKTVELKVQGPFSLIRELGSILLQVEPSEENEFSGLAKIDFLGKNYTAIGKVEYDDLSSFKKFSGSALTPWRSVGNVDVILDVSRDSQTSKAVTKFQWEGGVIDATLGYSYESEKIYGIEIQISTPFQDAEVTNFVVSHTSDTTIGTSAKIHLPKTVTSSIWKNLDLVALNYQSSLENTFYVGRINATGSVRYLSSESKLVFGTNWDILSMDLAAEHNIVVEVGNNVLLASDGKAAYSKEDGNTAFHHNLQLSDQEKMGAKIDGQFSKDTSDGMAEVSMGTSSFKLNLNHGLSTNKKSVRSKAVFPNGEEYEAQFNYERNVFDNSRNAQIHILCPINGLEDFKGDLLIKKNSTGMDFEALVKQLGETVLSLNATVDEKAEGPLKEYKGVVSLESSFKKLSILKAAYDKKYTGNKNSEHELALIVNDFDESKWKYVKAIQQDATITKEEVELEGKYIIWPVAINYLYIKEYPTRELQTSVVKRRFSMFDADEPKLRGDFNTIVKTTQYGKEFSIEISKVNFTTRYSRQRGNWSHGSLLKLAPDGSRNFGYDIDLFDLSKAVMSQYRIKVILNVPQRSIGFGCLMKANDRSSGIVIETHWDLSDRSRYLQLYFQIDDVIRSNGDTGKEWKLGVKQRRLNQDLLIEGDLVRDATGKIKGSSMFQYLPGKDNRLKGTIELGGSAKWWELEETSGLTLSLPKAKLDTILSQMFSLNLRSMKFESSVRHSRDESNYKSARQLELKRVPEGMLVYKVILPEGTFESVGSISRNAGDMLVAYRTSADEISTSEAFFNYTIGIHPYLKLHYNGSGSENIIYDLIYKWDNDRSVSLHAVSFTNGDMSIPIEGHLALNTSHFLSSSLIWTPTLFTDLKHSFGDYRSNKKTEIFDFIDQSCSSAINEIDQIIKFVSVDMEEAINPFKEDLAAEYDSLVEDSEAVQEVFEMMYEKNDFLMKTVVGLVKILLQEYPVETTLSEFKDWLSAKQEELTNGITSKTYDFESWANDLGEQIENLRKVWSNNIYEPVVAAFTQLGEALAVAFQTRMISYETFMNAVGNRLSRWVSATASSIRTTLFDFSLTLYDQLKPGFLIAMDLVETSVLQVTNKISNLFSPSETVNVGESFLKNMEIFFEKISELVEELSVEKMQNFFSGYYTSFVESLERKAGNFGGQFATVIRLAERLNAYISDLYQDNFESTGDLAPVIQNLRVKLIPSVSFESIGDAVLDVYDKAVSAFSRSATQTLIDLREYRTKMLFVPEEGQFVLEQVLPFAWHSLNEKPDLKDLKNSQIFTNYLSFLDDEENEDSIWNTIVSFMDNYKMLHPFDSFATVDFSGRVSTFNGFHYEISGNCSYTLLRNFETKGSSIVIKRVLKTSKEDLALTILSGIDKFDIFPGSAKEDEVILLNGIPLILPFNNDVILVSFVKNNITLRTEDMRTSCYLDRGFCEVTVFGRSARHYAGILGRPDLEYLTDGTTPSGAPTNISEFLSSWEASRTSCVSQKVKHPAPLKDDLCTSYFENSSSGLASCYGAVDPKPYLSHCSSSQLGKNLKGNGRCTAVSMYASHCQRKGVPVTVPDTCLRCLRDESSQIRIGNFRTITVGTSSSSKPRADILFIIENADCLKTISKRLKELITTVDKELQSFSKIKNNRYGFIIYGSTSEIVSSNKAQLFDEKKAQEILKHISTTYPSKAFGNASLDLSAVKLALEAFPFRSEASKSVVLIPCSTCGPSNVAMHRGLLSSLESSGIPLHVIFSEDFSFLKANEKRTISGFDGQGGITNKRAEAARVVVQNHQQLVTKSAGVCADLVFRSNGTIFAAPRLLDQKQDNGKRSVMALARQVALRAHPKACQYCRCSQDGNNIETQMVCEPCDTNKAKFGG